ncbi:MFS transporter [Penicillium malachiteum]|uniref:MFS transporter n=1 Tax=Penicillium malachiteum TaxID=1324776 RepID=A0AAD6HBR8_9EURO|nr:MFS transporter [Penicillium malachiteum]
MTKRLEDELQITIYPGTEIMTDVGTHHFVRQSGTSSTVLVPQSSLDPRDPLNWNRWWKFCAIFWAMASSFFMCLGPLFVSPMFGYLEEEFDRSLSDVVQFTGVVILGLGFSNFFWVPIADTFGRRPVLVFSAIICLGSNAWRSVATSYTSFLGACALNGFSAGPCETLAPQVITDVLFLHERGFYNTLYFTFYFGSFMIGPIISDVMALHVGWRSFWWLNVAGCALLITKWDRVQPAGNNPSLATNTSQNTQANQMTSEKEVTVQEENKHSKVTTNSPDEAFDPFLHKGRPSKGQFNFYQIGNDWVKSLWLAFWVPWQMHLFPIVHFAAFVSQVLGAPPYKWSSQSIGFTNFALVVGVIIGLATNGPMSDWVSMRATKKNGGIREPEMRLPTMIPYVIIAILGNFIVAFGYEYQWDWRVIVIIGYTCAGIQVAALPAITSTYAVDSYKPVVGSIFVTITGYGFSKFITPCTEKDGYLPAIMTNMCLTTLWCSFGFLFYFAGKNYFRR